MLSPPPGGCSWSVLCLCTSSSPEITPHQDTRSSLISEICRPDSNQSFPLGPWFRQKPARRLNTDWPCILQLHCGLHLYADLVNLDPFHKVLDIESCIIGEIEGFSTPNRFSKYLKWPLNVLKSFQWKIYTSVTADCAPTILIYSSHSTTNLLKTKPEQNMEIIFSLFVATILECQYVLPQAM